MSTSCVLSILNWRRPTYRIIVDNNTLLYHGCDLCLGKGWFLSSILLIHRDPEGGETTETTNMVVEDHFQLNLFLWRDRQTIHISVSSGNIVGSVGCVFFFSFFNCKCLRLWSISKERGGHPRWPSTGVAALRGNPGQEGRNQGGRVHERVSGETLSGT